MCIDFVFNWSTAAVRVRRGAFLVALGLFGLFAVACGSASEPGPAAHQASKGLSVAPVVRLTPASIGANGVSWADANGSGVVFSAGPGDRKPQLLTDANGRPGVRFSGWQYMQGSLGDTASWNGVTVVAVFKTVSVPALATVLSSGGAAGSPSASPGVRWDFGAGADPARGLGWVGADGSTGMGPGNYKPSTQYVMVWKRGRTSSGWTVRRNGQTLTTAPIPDSSFPTGTFRAFLGSEFVPNGQHAGGSYTLFELHVYRDELTVADTSALEQQLADTYHVGWYADGATERPDALLGSDLVGWYDAFDLRTTHGSPVSSWPNRAGNSALAASGAAQPVLEADGINGHPSVTADGVDDVMLATLNPPMPTGSRPHFWAVLRAVTPRPATSYVRVGQGSGYLVTLGTNNGTSPNWLGVIRGQSAVVTPTAASANNTEAHIVSSGISANLLDHLKVDGVSAPATVDPGPIGNPISAIRLFAAESSGFANLRIGEVIVSRGTPTPEVDRAVHRYLAAKWRPAAGACGNAVIDPGEQCDDGNAIGSDSCRNNCTLSTDPLVVLAPASIGANATTWSDTNGGSVVFQAGAGSQAPQLTDLFGTPAVRFTGGQHMVASLGNASQWSGVTITAVVRTDAGIPALGTLLGSGGPAGAPSATAGVRWRAGIGADAARGLGWAGTTGSTNLGGGAFDPNTNYVMTWKRSRNGAGWTVRKNGTAITTVPVADGSFPSGEFRAYLGAEQPGGVNGGALILLALHVYPRELSAAETTQLEIGLAETHNVGWYADGPITAPDALFGTDLVAWYDASALSAADGTPLASWPNRAANSPLTAAGAVQPLFRLNAVNGHPGVVADGVDDSMLAALNPLVASGSRPHVWLVLQHETLLPGRSFIQVSNPSNNQGVFIGSSSTNWLTSMRGAAGYSSATSSANDLRAHILSAGLSADFQRQHFTLDGAPRSGAIDPGATSVTIPEIRVFSAWNNTLQQTFAHANSKIGEIIVTRTSPTPALNHAVHRYLASKWRTTPARCGDGIVQQGEQCDDGNTTDGDACHNSCTDGRCSAANPCGSGEGVCVDDAGCEPGLSCGVGVGPRFGYPADARVCWNSAECVSQNAVKPPCGAIDAACGLCCTPRCGTPGQPDGCGGIISSADSDADGAIDCADECPFDSARTSAAQGGCAAPACQGSPSALLAQFECVLSAEGQTAAVFAVTNSSSCVVDVPIGEQNMFLNGTASLGQPTRFLPGINRVTIAPFTGPLLAWRLGGASTTASTGGPACSRVSVLGDSAVTLGASNDPQGTPVVGQHDSTTSVPFKIPQRLHPESGFAGNGTAQLTYRDGAGQLVTCSYRGGSPSATPVSDLDFARGQTYRFEACSNGAAAGTSVTGTHFELRVGGGDARFGRTTIDLHLGPGCDGQLDPPLWPEDVVGLREGFSWSATSELPTTDNQGLPAMRYAMLYIEDKVQIDGLRRAGIYFRQRPLFETELARYDGQCGELGTASDSRGTFVYAFIPAVVYNRLRSEALSAIGAGQQPPFRAILLPAIPTPTAANSDGTLSWAAMKASDFWYYDRPTGQQPLFGILGDLVEWVTEAGEDVWEAGTAAIGAVDRFLVGSVRVELEFLTRNKDPLFPKTGRDAVMKRAWGPLRGNQIVPRGIEVEILARVGDIPESFWGKLRGDGKATIHVAKRSQARRSGMCLHLENDAAMISRGITEYEFCDFDGLREAFNGFTQDVSPEIHIGSRHYRTLAQLTDSYDYTRSVIGRTPSQAEVLVGTWANLFGKINNQRAFVSCLDFAEQSLTAGTLVNTIAGQLGVVVVPLGQLDGTFVTPIVTAIAVLAGRVSEPILAKDIYLPTGNTPDDRPNPVIASRGVATHEYGHYLMCDVYSRTPGSLVGLYLDRLSEGFDDEVDDHTAILMESFADLFASQVVGGVNYAWLNRAAPSESFSYCIASPCLEENHRGTSSYHEIITRLVSTYYDAFDRPDHAARSQNFPTNGDAWTGTTSGLLLDPAGYEMDGDDEVSLPGRAIFRWLQFHPHHGIVDNLWSLAQTMYEEGVTWCDACDLFAQHDPTIPSPLGVRTTWEACTQGELRQILGPPPDPHLNLHAPSCAGCPQGYFSDASGLCSRCPNDRDIVIDNVCQTCPDGTVPNGQILNECRPCVANEVSNGRSCEPCLWGSTPDRATNQCASCPANFVLDWATSLTPACDWQQALNLAASDPVCPVVVDIRNVQVIPPVALPITHFDVQAFNYRNQASSQACLTSDLDLHFAVESWLPSGQFASRAEHTITVGGAPCTQAPCQPNCIYTHNLASMTPQEIQASGAETVRILIDKAELADTITHLRVTTGSCGPE